MMNRGRGQYELRDWGDEDDGEDAVIADDNIISNDSS